MQCELCGKPIIKGKKVRIEGSVVTACGDCADIGEEIKQVKANWQPRKSTKQEVKELKENTHDFGFDFGQELVEDYGQLVKRTREKRDLKQKELGQRINESSSVIKKIEKEKLEPSKELGKKIENTLDIQLFEKPDSEELDLPDKKDSDEMTLGDVVVVRNKQKQNKQDKQEK